jgi:hypothetical protein
MAATYGAVAAEIGAATAEWQIQQQGQSRERHGSEHIVEHGSIPASHRVATHLRIIHHNISLS